MVQFEDPFVSAILNKVEMGFSRLVSRYNGRTGMEAEIQRLWEALPLIKAVVKSVENGHQQITGGRLEAWLRLLKDALYEADDLLDDLEHDHLIRLKEQQQQQQHSKVRRFFTHSNQELALFIRRVFRPQDDPISKLRRVVDELVVDHVDVGNLLPLVSSSQQQQQLQLQHATRMSSASRETESFCVENIVFGRNKEEEDVVKWLISSPSAENNNNLSLYSIVGQGGIGKTTLVQIMYNDEIVRHFFDLRIWVSVSATFDVKGITAAILESVTLEMSQVDSLTALQDALKEKMSSKKFLLVLDDVWNDDNTSDWGELFAPLRYGHKESKVLLTTRLDRVAEIAAQAIGVPKEYMKLKGISDDCCLSLLNKYAFAGVNPGDYERLQSISERIARKLLGVPLVAKMVGALLNSDMDARHWTNILDSVTSDYTQQMVGAQQNSNVDFMHRTNISNRVNSEQQREGNIRSILMLSYHDLPLYLRPCFAYCSIFPHGYHFHKDDLVRMWMVLGLIQEAPQNYLKKQEAIGGSYFDDLVKRSIFECRFGYRGKCYYIMNNNLHEVAQLVSHYECFRFVGNRSLGEIPNTVRHLYIETDDLNLLTEVDKWKNLRTLVLVFKGYVPEHAKVFKKVFKSLRCIRVLNIFVDGMVALPDAIGHQRHIRILEIDHTVCDLPKSLDKFLRLHISIRGEWNAFTSLSEYEQWRRSARVRRA